jgi:hypothetical protein
MELLIGALMTGISVIIHAVSLDIIIRHTDDFERYVRKFLKSHWKPVVTGSVVLAVFCGHVIIIWCWAFLYHLMSCAPLEGFSDALYFATVVYSTLGFGDIVLEKGCRMLSGVEGANGFILFSWTAAFIFEVVGQIYKKEAKML